MKTVAFSLLVLVASISFGQEMRDFTDLAKGESLLTESSRGNKLIEVSGPTANVIYSMGKMHAGHMRKQGPWICYLAGKDNNSPVCRTLLESD